MKGVTWELTEEHLDLWTRGFSCARIAERAGVCRETVCRAMRKRGFDLRHRPAPVIEEAIKASQYLRSSGMAMRDIADVVGYSRRQIQRWLNPKNTAP